MIEVEGRCMRGSDGKLCFNKKERGKVWKDYMERIMNEENDWDCNVEGDAVEGPVDFSCKYESLQVLNEMKTEKPLDIQMCHWGCLLLAWRSQYKWWLRYVSVLYGFRIPVELALSVIASILLGRVTSGTAVAIEMRSFLSMECGWWKGCWKKVFVQYTKMLPIRTLDGVCGLNFFLYLCNFYINFFFYYQIVILISDKLYWNVLCCLFIVVIYISKWPLFSGFWTLKVEH